MKFKNVLIFFSLSFCYIPLHAHNFCEEAFYNFPDSISQITGSQETKHPTAKESFKRNFSYMGIPFITAGLIVKERNTDFRTLRNRFKPAFHHRYDDYTQYVPLAATWGMKLAGVQSRSSWKETGSEQCLFGCIDGRICQLFKIHHPRNPSGQYIQQLISFRTYGYSFHVCHHSSQGIWHEKSLVQHRRIYTGRNYGSYTSA